MNVGYVLAHRLKTAAGYNNFVGPCTWGSGWCSSLATPVQAAFSSLDVDKSLANTGDGWVVGHQGVGHNNNNAHTHTTTKGLQAIR